MIATGYFGIPGAIWGRFTVHVVCDGVPVCGVYIDPRAEFQWCANGYQWTYVECKRCHAKMRDNPTDRFWSKVRRTDSCWLFCGHESHGYGRFHISRRATMPAHRFSWELKHGPIRDGLCVLHKCDVPLCVNPDHLFLGTRRENSADMKRKARCRHGEHHYAAKLNNKIVRDIRSSTLKQAELSAKYGISQGAVSMIRNRKTWVRA